MDTDPSRPRSVSLIIVLLDVLEPALAGRLQDENVLYRPDWLHERPATLGRLLASVGARAVVLREDLAAQALTEWLSPISCQTFQVRVDATDGPLEVSKETTRANHTVLWVRGENRAAAYVGAFGALEGEWVTLQSWSTPSAPRDASYSRAKNDVVLIGAGLVNLVTAYTLQRAGFTIHLVDRFPDPRTKASWTHFGCSRGGDDARMFTPSEMDNYHDKEIRPDMNDQFRRTVAEGGWTVYRPGTLSLGEQEWIREFEGVPSWLANKYNNDIFTFNWESHRHWQKWMERDPDLFAASFLREGILRLFSDPDVHKAQSERQRLLGALRRVLSAEEVADAQPALADAVVGGRIAGGIDGVGFTVQAHAFMEQLLARLERGGAVCSWDLRAGSIVFGGDGAVCGIQTPSGVLEADHYVLSPGAYADTLLAGTLTEGKIHGVLGAWVQLPNISPELTTSLKLRRTGHVTEAANITIATDGHGVPVLIIGSGYGYTGVNPANVDRSLLRAIYIGIMNTAQEYFPKSFQAASDVGGLQSTLKYCVRPWTATCLGIFEELAAQGGGKCVITGGHNTGGFAQAPAVACAVHAALRNRDHPMHHLYHPARSSSFRTPHSTRGAD